MRLSRGWTVKRVGLSLDKETSDYIESQRARLGSLTLSELIRDLLREHERMCSGNRAELEQMLIGKLLNRGRQKHATANLARGGRKASA